MLWALAPMIVPIRPSTDEAMKNLGRHQYTMAEDI
jgi:hypothetical protein